MIKLAGLLAKRGGYALIAVFIVMCVIGVYRAGKDVERAKGKLAVSEQRLEFEMKANKNAEKQFKTLQNEYHDLLIAHDSLTREYRITKIEADTLFTAYNRLHRRHFGTDVQVRKLKAEIQKKYNLQFGGK